MNEVFRNIHAKRIRGWITRRWDLLACGHKVLSGILDAATDVCMRIQRDGAFWPITRREYRRAQTDSLFARSGMARLKCRLDPIPPSF